eukprot:TRINITY_DN64904_c0_g1_i1.p1 TRINITY_DN64904_c0_g1~~TRINITY_DN64904_c0_g1_i1.p1  ORF type:complete len:471 (+),score=85.77 TRINITY_DN64904_c0_g1_i1:51-1463(+)
MAWYPQLLPGQQAQPMLWCGPPSQPLGVATSPAPQTAAAVAHTAAAAVGMDGAPAVASAQQVAPGMWCVFVADPALVWQQASSGVQPMLPMLQDSSAVQQSPSDTPNNTFYLGSDQAPSCVQNSMNLCLANHLPSVSEEADIVVEPASPVHSPRPGSRPDLEESPAIATPPPRVRCRSEEDLMTPSPVGMGSPGRYRLGTSAQMAQPVPPFPTFSEACAAGPEDDWSPAQAWVDMQQLKGAVPDQGELSHATAFLHHSFAFPGHPSFTGCEVARVFEATSLEEMMVANAQAAERLSTSHGNADSNSLTTPSPSADAMFTSSTAAGGGRQKGRKWASAARVASHPSGTGASKMQNQVSEVPCKTVPDPMSAALETLLHQVLLRRPELEAGKRVVVPFSEWLTDVPGLLELSEAKSAGGGKAPCPVRALVNRALRHMSRRLPGAAWTVDLEKGEIQVHLADVKRFSSFCDGL